MRETNEKFDSLPKEYFAQKFSNPSFPPMEPGICWGMMLANMIFYIINLVWCADDEVAVMQYSSIGVMTIAALMVVARIYWSKKRMQKHKVGYIHFVAWLFGEFRLMFMSMMVIVVANVMSDGVSGQDEMPIIIGVYIGAAVLIVVDIVLNIVFWEVMKRKVIEGAFKENGKGFFGNIKNKGKISSAIQTYGRYIMILCLAFIPLSRLFDIRWNTALNPVLGVLVVMLILGLSVTFAYADAFLLGRAHYVKKFELGAQTEAESEDKRQIDTSEQDSF